jgi:hypothetical protein
VVASAWFLAEPESSSNIPLLPGMRISSVSISNSDGSHKTCCCPLHRMPLMRPELIWQLARILTPGLRTSGRNIAVVNQFAPVINQEMAASVCETIKHGHQVWCSPIPARASVSVTMNMRVSVPKSSTRRRKLRGTGG